MFWTLLQFSTLLQIFLGKSYKAKFLIVLSICCCLQQRVFCGKTLKEIMENSNTTLLISSDSMVACQDCFCWVSLAKHFSVTLLHLFLRNFWLIKICNFPVASPLLVWRPCCLNWLREKELTTKQCNYLFLVMTFLLKILRRFIFSSPWAMKLWIWSSHGLQQTQMNSVWFTEITMS